MLEKEWRNEWMGAFFGMYFFLDYKSIEKQNAEKCGEDGAYPYFYYLEI